MTNQDEYLEQRLRLQQELDELTPIPTNEIEQAADILDNFPTHWQATNGDRKVQRELIQTIVERVYIEGKHVDALVLKPNYFIALGTNKEKSSEEINSPEDIHKREGQESIRTFSSRRPR